MQEGRYPELDPVDVGGLLSDQFAALEDAEPVAPRVVQEDGRIRYSFRWPLSPYEELLDANRPQALGEFRRAVIEAIAPSLAEVLEATVHRDVAVAGTSVEGDCRAASFWFLLGSPIEDVEEERQAIRNWSAQVRRNARLGRVRQRAIKAEMVKLTEEVRQRRQEFAARPKR